MTSRGPLTRLAWVLVPVVLLIVVAEGVLAVVGLEEYSATESFIDGALVERDEAAGGVTVRFAGERARDVLVTDPRGARRVFLFGGSNTQGFPEDTLSASLDELTRSGGGPGGSGPDWEVFNLGRAGYGSWRVRLVLEQALTLEPDDVVLYCGHNEFVEAGFVRERQGALEDADALGPRWYERLASFRLLARAFRRAPESVATSSPRTVRPVEPDNVRAWVTSYDQTREVYDRYAQNLEAMIASAREAGARVLVCTLVANDFSGHE